MAPTTRCNLWQSRRPGVFLSLKTKQISDCSPPPPSLLLLPACSANGKMLCVCVIFLPSSLVFRKWWKMRNQCTQLKKASFLPLLPFKTIQISSLGLIFLCPSPLQLFKKSCLSKDRTNKREVSRRRNSMHTQTVASFSLLPSANLQRFR